MGLPQGVGWTKEVLMYIVKNKVTDVKKIEYKLLLEEMFPGQTGYSLAVFVNSIAKETVNRKQYRCNEPLHKICLRRLNQPDHTSYLGNNNRAASKLKYAEDIIKIYKSLIV